MQTPEKKQELLVHLADVNKLTEYLREFVIFGSSKERANKNIAAIRAALNAFESEVNNG